MCGELSDCYRGWVLKSRTLKVKCPTWDHVEKFYAHKLRNGNRLSIRVPFNLDQGDKLNIALELPSEMVMVIDGEVERCQPAADGKRYGLDIHLAGMTKEMRARLERLVGQSRGDIEPSGELSLEALDPDGLPVAQPADAPMDERVEPMELPRAETLRGKEREVFTLLEQELQSVKEAAAHEALGVAWDADVAAIRAAYFKLTKRFHPDAYARHQSEAILLISQEIFIYINKAYDRMRDAAVESGAAIVAGPALLPHDGWLTQFDDIGTEGSDDRRVLAPPTPPPDELVRAMQKLAAKKKLEKKPAAPPPVPTNAAPTAAAPAPAPAPAPASAAPAKPSQAERHRKSTSQPVVQFNKEPEKETLSDSLFGDMDLEKKSGLHDLEIPEERVDAMEAEGRELLAAGDAEKAQAVFTQALQVVPRNRRIRALYHLARAKPLIKRRELVQAVAQLKAALTHDPQCEEARVLMDELEEGPTGKKRTGLFKRFFK